MLKVLFAAAEAAPFVKTGGLADVAGSLPKAVKQEKTDIRVVMPKYSAIPDEYKSRMETVYVGTMTMGWRELYLGIQRLVLNGVIFYFIDNEQYFRRDKIYGEADDGERFGFFSKAVLKLMAAVDFFPDVLHLNDWHTAMAAVYLHTHYWANERYKRIKTVYTIHNLKYQGVFPPQLLENVLGIDMEHFYNGSVEFNGAVNFMKSAIVFADQITTVSETYAGEIQNPYFGEGLDQLLRDNRGKLLGILNGIDYDEYNPAADAKLACCYDSKMSVVRKNDNKVVLQRDVGLPETREVPMLAIVSRLVAAKGLDLVSCIIEELLHQEDIQLVILGTGDEQYEQFMQNLAWRYPRKVAARIYFDDVLAHRIYAGTDFFMMPSQYEPCGIGQMIAMRYGTVPIVRETGGLNDTVVPFNKYDEQGTGITFGNYNAHELLFAIKRALNLYIDQRLWRILQKNCMTVDHSWNQSAAKYRNMYSELSATE